MDPDPFGRATYERTLASMLGPRFGFVFVFVFRIVTVHDALVLVVFVLVVVILVPVPMTVLRPVGMLVLVHVIGVVLGFHRRISMTLDIFAG